MAKIRLKKGQTLTTEMLDAMEPGEIFAEGIAVDEPNDLNFCNTGRHLKWVAVRGKIGDWAIYVGIPGLDNQRIKAFGDKIGFKPNIKHLVPCTEQAFERYRF